MKPININEQPKYKFQYPENCPSKILGPNIIIREVAPTKQGQIHLPEGTTVRLQHFIEDFDPEQIDPSLKGKIKKGDEVVVKFFGDEAIVAKRSTETQDLTFIMMDQYRLLAIY